MVSSSVVLLSVLPRARRSSPLHHFAQRSDAFLVLVYRADGDADPFRQIVTFHRPHDHFALKQSAKNGETVADVH